MANKTLKSYRNKELKQFVLATTLVIMFFINSFNFSSQELNGLSEYIVKLIQSGIGVSAFYMYILLMDSIYPAQWKEHIVNLWKDMPGYTVFSDLYDDKIKDFRINPKLAKDRYQKIYSELQTHSDQNQRNRFENSSWYTIYKKYQTEGSVQDANRSYLAYRDMSVASVNMFILYLLGSIGFRIAVAWQVIIWLIVLYLATRSAARNKARRLVTSVLACDLSEKKE